MDDALVVGRGERRGELAAQAQHVAVGHLADSLQALVEGLPLQVLHGQVGDAARLVAVVKDLDDAGMGDEVGGARLVEEAAGDLGVAGVLRAEDLDRGAHLDVLAHRLVDDAHAALSELAYEPVFTDALTDHLPL